MPRSISHDIKSKIISDYLKGFSRDENAERNKLLNSLSLIIVELLLRQTDKLYLLKGFKQVGKWNRWRTVRDL